jgi:type VI secretion system secreted protein VgrG
MYIRKLASEASFLFEVEGLQLRIADFTVREEVSSPFEADLTLVAEDEIGFDDVIGKEALLTIIGEEGDRYFHGIINEFVLSGTSGEYMAYQAKTVPYIWFLSLEQDSRIFQDMTTQDIVIEVLKKTGIMSDRFEFRLEQQYQKREYCVQYRETDLNFINRLLEEEGIFYFFEHTKDNHLLVFGDSKVNYQPIDGDDKIMFHPVDAMVPEEDFIHSFLFSRHIHPGKVTLRDFNFLRPELDLTASQENETFKNLEMYDYPGEYLDDSRGKKIAEIRLQEAAMFQDKAQGRSCCSRFTPGFTFTLKDHDLTTLNQEYLIFDVVHIGSQPQTLAEVPGAGAFSYSNEFLCIPSSVTLRPERKTPKPIVEGVQTAIVVGPAGEEIYTDKYGRVKVQFHWDREGKKDENSSCWIRVSQLWAGENWGAMFIPRIGQEVVIDFVEGDPDRPIITGRVYHGTNLPPHALPDEKTKSTIKSNSTKGGGGFNELRFEDKKGSEEIFLHGQKDWNITILNNKNQNIGVNDQLSVGNNQVISIGVNRSESVGQNESVSVGANKTETVATNKAETIGVAKELTIGGAYQVTVGAAMNESVGALKAEEIGAHKTVLVGGNSSEDIGGNMSVNVGKDFSEKVDGKHDEQVTKEYTLKAKKVQITADDEIAIRTGSARITMKKNGDITLSGANITVKGSGNITLKGSKIIQN